MRLRPDQLDQNLGKGLLPIYIVSGDEPLLVQECSDAIRLSCRKQGFSREVLQAAVLIAISDLSAIFARVRPRVLRPNFRQLDPDFPGIESGPPGDRR